MNDDRTRRWLAFLRIYVGALWLAYGSSKFELDWAAPNGEFYQAAKFIESIEALLFVCCALLVAGRTGAYASLDALLFKGQPG